MESCFESHTQKYWKKAYASFSTLKNHALLSILLRESKVCFDSRICFRKYFWAFGRDKILAQDFVVVMLNIVVKKFCAVPFTKFKWILVKYESYRGVPRRRTRRWTRRSRHFLSPKLRPWRWGSYRSELEQASWKKMKSYYCLFNTFSPKVFRVIKIRISRVSCCKIHVLCTCHVTKTGRSISYYRRLPRAYQCLLIKLTMESQCMQTTM